MPKKARSPGGFDRYLSRRQALKILAVGGAAGAAWKLGLHSFPRSRTASRTAEMMGTTIHLTVVGEDFEQAEAAVDATLGRMIQVEALLTRHNADSQVSTLNATGKYTGLELANAYDYVFRELAARGRRPRQRRMIARTEYPYYERLYLAQAFWQHSDPTVYSDWAETEERELVVDQELDEQGRGYWTHRRFGNCYATAVNCLVAYYGFGFYGGVDHWTGHHTYTAVAGSVLLAMTPCGRSWSVDRWWAVRRAERGGRAPPPERGHLFAQGLGGTRGDCSGLRLTF